jgi:hypothetical protein
MRQARAVLRPCWTLRYGAIWVQDFLGTVRVQGMKYKAQFVSAVRSLAPHAYALVLH